MMRLERADLRERIELHRSFWFRRGQKRPIASFRIGDFFFSRHFEAARPLLVRHKLITPEMLDVPAYMPDYERMFADAEAVAQDGFWTAEPFTGIPWMEAILGCEVRAGEESFTTRHLYGSAAEAADATGKLLDDIRAMEPGSTETGNGWLDKYLEFSRSLVEAATGRFTVGEPIMRGPTDMVGALLGQSEMIFALADEPEAMERLARNVTSIFLLVVELQQALVPPFHGGSALGFYHVWAPGPSIWFQDDLASVLSPSIYRDVFVPQGRTICSGYDYTAVHLHPSSFFILDELLAIERLKVIEVNKDVGGPSVEQMLPTLSRIMERKGLILWGDLTTEDLQLIERNLPVDGLFLHIVASDLDEARRLNTCIRNWKG